MQNINKTSIYFALHLQTNFDCSKSLESKRKTFQHQITWDEQKDWIKLLDKCVDCNDKVAIYFASLCF